MCIRDRSVCKAGDEIIVPRNVHKSVINVMILCGAIPVYINAEEMCIRDSRYGAATSMTLAVEAFDTSGNTSTRQIVVTDAGDKVRYTDHKAGYFELSDDGIYVSEKLLSILGLKVGDNVSWSVYGEEKTYTTGIAGTFREPQ